MIVRIRQRLRRDECGATTAVELMIVLPALVLLVFGIVQMALCWHARNVVEAAAEEASRIASAADGGCAAARVEGAALASRLGGSFLERGTSVTCTEGAAVTVRVAGRSLSILPGLRFPVAASAGASAPEER